MCDIKQEFVRLWFMTIDSLMVWFYLEQQGKNRQNAAITYANVMHCYAKVCGNDSLSAKRTKKQA